MPQISKALSQFVQIAIDGMRMFQFRYDSLGASHGDAALANEQVAGDRDGVGAEVEQQYSTQVKMVVDESNDPARDQPSALHARHEEVTRSYILRFGRELLNERGHRWPEHPESGGHQRVHQVQLPEAHFARKGQHGNDEDDQSARAIEKHYEMATIFAVDDDTGEWQHQQRRERLQ